MWYGTGVDDGLVHVTGGFRVVHGPADPMYVVSDLFFSDLWRGRRVW
jgi:hypothetical protein